VRRAVPVRQAARTLETRANDASLSEAAQELGISSDIEEERRLFLRWV